MFCLGAAAQPIRDNPALRTIDTTYRAEVQNVRCYFKGNELGNPVILLNQGEQVQVEFDLLTDDVPDLTYTLLHCNANWQPSRLNDYEYIDGFTENSLYDYQFSRNTQVSYIHYGTLLPNEDMRITKSGNYILAVYDDDDSLYFTQRFYVTELITEVTISDRRPIFPEYYRTHQELVIDIATKNIALRNPFQELQVHVLQNFRYDNAYLNLTPVFVKEDKLTYFSDGRVIFFAGKEFRNFDSRNLSLLNSEIERATLRDVYLFQDDIRAFEQYNFMIDANGKFVTGIADGFDQQLEADYMNTHFKLKTYNPYIGGGIYIIGELSDWQLKPDFKLAYNYETKCYEKSVLLKQGYYNYMYAYVRDGDSTWNTSLFEGDWFETENTYQVLIYFRPTGERYDRLIGYKNYNSLADQ